MVINNVVKKISFMSNYTNKKYKRNVSKFLFGNVMSFIVWFVIPVLYNLYWLISTTSKHCNNEVYNNSITDVPRNRTDTRTFAYNVTPVFA